jgi:hypothetical protein
LFYSLWNQIDNILQAYTTGPPEFFRIAILAIGLSGIIFMIDLKYYAIIDDLNEKPG